MPTRLRRRRPSTRPPRPPRPAARSSGTTSTSTPPCSITHGSTPSFPTPFAAPSGTRENRSSEARRESCSTDTSWTRSSPVAQALARRRLPVLRRPVARPGERQQQPSHPRAAGQDSIPANTGMAVVARHWRNSQCPPQEQGAAGRGPEQDRPGQCLWPQDRVLRAGLRIQQSREQRDSR